MGFSDQDVLALANDTMAQQGDSAWVYAIEQYGRSRAASDSEEAGKWLRIAAAIDQISARRESVESED